MHVINNQAIYSVHVSFLYIQLYIYAEKIMTFKFWKFSQLTKS